MLLKIRGRLRGNNKRLDYTGSTTAVDLVSLFKACVVLRDVETSKLVHLAALENGHLSHSAIFVANALITMYSRCGSFLHAKMAFDNMPFHSVASWNSMINAYTENGEPGLALEMFSRMLIHYQPDPRTFVAAAGACTRLAETEEAKQVDGSLVKVGSLEIGRGLHRKSLETNTFDNMFVGNSLVDMYGKCGSMDDAKKVFDKMISRDVVSWTALISGYVENGSSDVALQLFSRMVNGNKSCVPNSRTYAVALKACASLAVESEEDKVTYLKKGREIHSQAKEMGCEMDIYVASTLVDMYSKCVSLKEAEEVFGRMVHRDVVVWNALLLGYVENDQPESALKRFNCMREQEHVVPDSVTFVAALMACSSLAAEEKATMDLQGKLLKLRCLQTGTELYRQAVKLGYGNELSVANSLVVMYCKCGSMAEAREVFETLGERRSLVSWNALILGYSEARESEKALELFTRMRSSGWEPSARTYVAVLMACGELTALEDGRRAHGDVCRLGHETDEFVSNCLVDFYCKSGSMSGAQQVFDSMTTRRSLVSWSSLVTGYSNHGDVRRVFELLENIHDAGLKPDRIVLSSVLAACSHAGLVERGRELFGRMVGEFGVEPDVDHYNCMVDLLGRYNHLQEALEMIRDMPFRPSFVTWSTLLSACRKWKNVEIGWIAFEALMKFDGKQSASYLLMADTLHY